MKNQVKKALILIVLLIIMFLGLSFLRPTGNVPFEITSIPGANNSFCQALNVSGTYILEADILDENVSSSGCFNISVSDVALDCASHIIRNTSIAQPAVYAENVKNISIKNCNIQMSNSSGSYGIYFSGVNDSYISSSNLSSNYIGIYIKSGYNNQINSNTISENSNKGLLIELGSGNTIQSNTLSSNKLAIYVLKSSSNTFNNNRLLSCTHSDGEGCLSLVGSSSNTITLGEINVSSGDLVTLYDSAGLSSSNNLFRNLLFAGAAGKNINSTKVSDASTNNSFINVSYSGKEVVSSGNEIIRKWYYRVLVNTSRGGLVSNANVTIYNASNSFVLYALTDSNGLISIQEIIAYSNTGAQDNRSYRVVASNASSSANHTLSLSNNNLVDFLTFNITIPTTTNTTSTNTTSTTASTNTTSTTTATNTTSTTTTTKTQTTETIQNNQNSGGSRISYYNLTDSQLEGGYEQEMDEGDTIFINSTVENHTVILERFIRNVSNYSVTIIVRSNPINVSLGLGEQRKVDANFDGYYDFLIGFKNITENDRPHILIAKINEAIPKISEGLAVSAPSPISEVDASFISVLLKKLNTRIFWKISVLHILIVVILATSIILYVYRARKNKVLDFTKFSFLKSSKSSHHTHSKKKHK